MTRLYNYFRSSASYRVRIALELKGLTYEYVPVHLTRNQQQAGTYRALNPQALVPTWEDPSGVFPQSLAIIEYLEETHPEPSLLPGSPAERARVRALAQIVACDVHPLNNLRVLEYLTRELAVGEAAKLGWYRHWVGAGLAAIERLLAESAATGTFCHGERPTLADACLVPQLYNARRFDCDLAGFPIARRIEAACLALPAFERATPERQPDAS
ncbi:MAG: maleylacetoacetate isomerase [Candidatus Binatia bacterium]